MNARVKKIKRETPSVVTLVVEPETPVDFISGQAMRWEALTGKGGRLFSIANAGGKGIRELWFTMKELPGGVVSSYAARLAVGDTVVLRGPYGKMAFDATDRRDIGFIAGGSGISVLRSMYEYALTHALPNKLTLLVSAPREREIIYADELKEISKKYKKFSCTVTLTREQPPNWTGERGHIEDEMFARVFGAEKIPTMIFYICGPKTFIDRAQSILQNRGVAPADIRVDKWVF